MVEGMRENGGRWCERCFDVVHIRALEESAANLLPMAIIIGSKSDFLSNHRSAPVELPARCVCIGFDEYEGTAYAANKECGRLE